MEWVASTLHTTSEHGVSSVTTAEAHTSAASSRLNCAPADLNGLARFAERRNLVSARVPSHFNWPLLKNTTTNLMQEPSIFFVETKVNNLVCFAANFSGIILIERHVFMFIVFTSVTRI